MKTAEIKVNDVYKNSIFTLPSESTPYDERNAFLTTEWTDSWCFVDFAVAWFRILEVIILKGEFRRKKKCQLQNEKLLNGKMSLILLFTFPITYSFSYVFSQTNWNLISFFITNTTMIKKNMMKKIIRRKSRAPCETNTKHYKSTIMENSSFSVHAFHRSMGPVLMMSIHTHSIIS